MKVATPRPSVLYWDSSEPKPESRPAPSDKEAACSAE